VTALDPLLAIAVAKPCVVGAPLLHRLVDGELPSIQTREAAEHAQRCPTCRDHLRWLELEEQTIREIAAPTPERFVALWSGRLRERLVAAISEEAGAELLRAAAGDDRSSSRWSRARDYLRQLAGWLGRGDVDRRCGTSGAALVAGFAELMGEEWPPSKEARRVLSSSAPRSMSISGRRRRRSELSRSDRAGSRAAARSSSPPP
jgi:anti-sigma factor RsiW